MTYEETVLGSYGVGKTGTVNWNANHANADSTNSCYGLVLHYRNFDNSNTREPNKYTYSIKKNGSDIDG